MPHPLRRRNSPRFGPPGGRYAPDHNIHRSLVQNDGDLVHARVWVVNDRGAENRQLAALHPVRRAYLYDQATDTFTPR